MSMRVRLVLAAVLAFSSSSAAKPSDGFLVLDMPVAGGSLTQDRDGRLHLVVLHEGDAGLSLLSGTMEQGMGEPRKIPGSEGAANPRIDVAADGTVHLVWQRGRYGQARASFYAAVAPDGTVVGPEKFADVADHDPDYRAYVPDVAADAAGHVLVTAWVSPNQGIYRWRSPAGVWSEPVPVAGYHPTPRVEQHDGGFYLYWLKRGDVEWALAGPIAPGGRFGDYVDAGGRSSGLTVHNEGGDFSVNPDGTILASGGARVAFAGPTTVWVASNASGTFQTHRFAGMAQTQRGDESHHYPDVVLDAATGDQFIVAANRRTKRTVFAHRPRGGAWTKLQPLLAEMDPPQASLRNGPTLADVPGPGVVAFTWSGNRGVLRVLPSPVARVAPDSFQ